MTAPLELGKKAESLAARELKKRGYKILLRNARSRYGEIDIVAEHDGALVVVEVKASSGIGDFGPPALRVGKAKKAKLRILAKDLLKRYKLVNTDVRFDVVSIVFDNDLPRIEVIPGAFE